MQPIVSMECFLKVTLQWAFESFKLSSCRAVSFCGIVLILIDRLIETDTKIVYDFLLITLRFNSPISYCLPWNFSSSWGKYQCLSVQWGELSNTFQISSVLLIDWLPERAHKSHRIGGPHFKRPALEESVYVWTLFFLFFPYTSENSTCIPNINTCT